MNESSEGKKRVFYTIVLLLTLICMLISTTIAYYSFVRSQKDEGTELYTGMLSIDYIDGVYIKNPELWPVKKVDFNTTKDVYRNTFKVVSSGTLDQTIAIDLIITRNDFYPGALKYKLYSENGKLLSSGKVPQEGNVNLVSDLFLAHNGIAKYVLIVWLDNTNYNQNFEMESVITGKLNIYSKQIKY